MNENMYLSIDRSGDIRQKHNMHLVSLEVLMQTVSKCHILTPYLKTLKR